MKKINLLISILSIFLIVGCNSNKPVNIPEEVNKNSVVFSEEVVEELIVRNHNVAYYDLYNENNTPITYSSVVIKYYHDTALIYSTEEVLNTISSNGSINISFDIDINLVNANRVEYELKK